MCFCSLSCLLFVSNHKDRSNVLLCIFAMYLYIKHFLISPNLFCLAKWLTYSIRGVYIMDVPQSEGDRSPAEQHSSSRTSCSISRQCRAEALLTIGAGANIITTKLLEWSRVQHEVARAKHLRHYH